jgi:hypothetical protein
MSRSTPHGTGTDRTALGLVPSIAPVDEASGVLRLRRLLAVTLALGGWLFGLAVFALYFIEDGPRIGGDLAAYLRAGDDLLAGRQVYVGQIGDVGAFNYAPPWAVLFAALSWVPDMLMQVGIMVLGMVCLRYIAGSWLWAGLAFWFPVTVSLLYAGNIELLIAAAVLIAWRGHAGALAFTALAKVAPVLGIPRSGWREAAVVVGLAVLVTLPWLYLWPEWIEYLLRQPAGAAFTFGPPWYFRLPFALALLALRRPWASATAVVVAMPALWLGTLVILFAAVRLWLDGRVVQVRS